MNDSTKEQMRKRIEEDPDFINCKRHQDSLQRLIDSNPNGCTDRVIAQALMIEESEVEEIYQGIVSRFRAMLVDEGSIH